GAGATAFLRVTSALRMFLIAGAGLGVVIGIIAALVKLDVLGFGEAWRVAGEAFRFFSQTSNPVTAILRAISAAIRSFDLGPLNALADMLDKIGTGVSAFWNAFNTGGKGGGSEALKTLDTAGLQIQKIADVTGADGFRYPLVTVNAETGELEEVGKILESHDDPNDP